MIPKFTGCYEYSPKTNPLVGLTKAEKEQFSFEYMQMWIDDNTFDDFQIMFDSGDSELMADSLVSAGAIDSKECFKSCQEIEKIIESWAKTFRKLTTAQRRRRYNKAFKNCMSVKCLQCNSIAFPDTDTFQIYEEELRRQCWGCSSTQLEITPWVDA